MNWVGAAKPLDDIDLPRIGHRIGVGEDEIHAVLDVEAGKSGFDSLKRVKPLFEPHIFYRQLGPGTLRDKAVAQGLAYPTWRLNYPADSYPRIEAAMKIHPVAALHSASWGRGQIMGYNHGAAGYADVMAMIEAFKADEENHVDAMVSFIATNQIDDNLRAHDWAGFAKVYNGPSYAVNKYDIKLRDAFAKWQKIRDTAWLPNLELSPVTAPKPIEVVATLEHDALARALDREARIRAILDEV